jgi:hypothetical protein
MTDQELAQLREELVKLRVTMKNMNWEAKRGLLVMFKSLDLLLLELDEERIECRRKGKTSDKYIRLLKLIEDQKDQLVLYHVMGRLM